LLLVSLKPLTGQSIWPLPRFDFENQTTGRDKLLLPVILSSGTPSLLAIRQWPPLLFLLFAHLELDLLTGDFGYPRPGYGIFSRSQIFARRWSANASWRNNAALKNNVGGSETQIDGGASRKWPKSGMSWPRFVIFSSRCSHPSAVLSPVPPVSAIER
jgi:hypothetical protein